MLLKAALTMASGKKPFSERSLSERYEVGEVLGRGAFGTASAARSRQDGRQCVLKVVEEGAVPKLALRHMEAEIHAEMNHRHIVKMYEAFKVKSQFIIAMEMCHGGELFDAVQSHGVCNNDEARHIFGQVMQAVNHIHSKGVAHRDLKMENFLLKEPAASLMQSTVKLIDFGFASRFEVGKAALTTVCGTPDYMAPEIFRNAPYSSKCDVWSCGVILYILLSGEPPFGGHSMEELVRNLRSTPVSFSQDVWQFVSEPAQLVVRRTCCKSVGMRWSTKQVLEGEWLQA